MRVFEGGEEASAIDTKPLQDKIGNFLKKKTDLASLEYSIKLY